MRYINGGIPTTLETIQTQILPTFLTYDEQRPWNGFWAAVDSETAAFLGWFCLRATNDEPLTAALGYRFRKAAWGKGYATEGAHALIAKGFSEWGIERVTATTYQDNLASQRVMDKVGMRLVRRFRITVEELQEVDTFNTDETELWDGDDVEYALKKAEWERSRTT
jgi:RimJ/RimL family protein N-acetyltransferase